MRKIEADSKDFKASFDSTGVKTAPPGQTTVVDFVVPDATVYLDGGSIIVWGANKGDWVSAEVVDPQGLYGPAGAVIYTWLKRWTLATALSGSMQDLMVEYKGEVYPGMALRLRYHNTGASPVDFAANYRLHELL